MNTALPNLENLDGSNGFTIPGKKGDRLGTSVYNAGDLNGDGIDDSIVTAANAGIASSDPYAYSYSDRRGEAYVIFGTSGNSNATFDLDNLKGNNGFKISGIDPNHELGSAVSVGDINGDGVGDLAVSAPNAGLTVSSYGYSYSQSNGEVYVIFGKQNRFAADFNLNNLNGNNGFILKGIDAEDLLGTAVTSAGDLNGDGIDDLAVSAAGGGQPVTNSNGFTKNDRRGEVYVVFGKQNGFTARPNLFNLNGSSGFIIDGKDANDSLGSSLSNAGDLNNDGIDDLIIGTANAGNVIDDPFGNGYSDRRGEVYVIFGKQNGFNSRFSVEDSLDGTNGFAISGTGIEDNLGNAVTNAGDLNGDGIDDLILGAVNASTNGEYTKEGQVYVIFGGQNNFGTQFDLNSLNGSNGFSIAGIDPGDGFGNAVSLGDFNGDGIDDLFVGANTAGNNISAFGYDYSDRRGQAYIIFGKNTGFTSQINLANLNSSVGSKVVGVSSEDLLGSAIASGGDLNGDGIDDLIVSAPDVDLGNEYTKEGTAYVIFGSSTNSPEELLLVGTNKADRLVGGAGNDKISGLRGNDTLIGNEGNDTLIGDEGNDNLYGDEGSDLLAGRMGNDKLFGRAGDDTLYGESGNDTLIGDEGNDNLYGDQGSDLLAGRTGNDKLFGRAGDDTLYGESGNDTLIGDEGNDNLYGDQGSDLLAGRTGNDKLFGESGNDTLYGESGNDRLDGGNDNDRLFGGNNNDLLIGGKGNDLLVGGSGDDTIDGTNPNNSVIQVGQKDTLVGNSGADLFILGVENKIYYEDGNPNTSGNADYASIRDFNPQQDRIQLGGGRNNYELSFYTNAQGGTSANILYLAPGAAPERIGILNEISSQLTLDDSVFIYDGRDLRATIDDRPVIFGTNRADRIEGGFSNNQISGLLGNDTLNGNEGNDTIGGNEDNDLLGGQSGNDSLFGNEGDDTLFGGSNDDRLEGNDGNDLLYGEDGGDLLLGDRGNDTVSGGNNNDTIYGGVGNDRLNGDNNQDRLFGDNGNDLLLGGTENDLLEGGSGNDTLIGTNYGNLELQLKEQDTLIGGAGADLLILGDSDRLFYNDRNPNTEGSTDYALIRGFDFSQDNILLQGDRSMYNLSFFADGSGTNFANIYYLEPGATPERIGIIENVSSDLTTANAAFVYV